MIALTSMFMYVDVVKFDLKPKGEDETSIIDETSIDETSIITSIEEDTSFSYIWIENEYMHTLENVCHWAIDNKD